MTEEKAISILDALAANTLDMYSYTQNNVVDAIDFMQMSLNRSKTLLKAAYDLLCKQKESPYVLNMLTETAIWDEAECDGYCLMDDIKYWFYDIGEYLDD